jgi:YLP motif-containing protein 1
VVSFEDLMQPPGRLQRPPRLVVIMRGLPGSGKTHVARAIKILETEQGFDAPRIISLDDYFECDGEVRETIGNQGDQMGLLKNRPKRSTTQFLIKLIQNKIYT